MNVDTGRIYEGDEIAAALLRGERIVPLGESIADALAESEARHGELLTLMGGSIVDSAAAQAAREQAHSERFVQQVNAQLTGQKCRR